MKRKHKPLAVDADRLRSPDPAVWLEPTERVQIVEMVDEARAAWAVDRDAPTKLDRLGPAARFPARLCDSREGAISLTEKLVVAYRRSLAGWQLAVAEHRPGAEVAAEYGLSHVCHPDEDGSWLASGPLDGLS